MPELPEVECVRRTLEPRLVGRRVERVLVHRADVIEGDASPSGLLSGATIAATRRRGKQLAIVAADGRTVVVHLGMSGQLVVDSFQRASGLPRTHVHVEWLIHGPDGARTWLVFRDPRRFGGICTLPSTSELDLRWKSLGPDALEVRAEELTKELSGTRRNVKAALLDQRVLAGVGNIYADEALFKARLAPTRLGNSISLAEAERLAGAIRETLAEAIKAGGSTLRDFVDGNGAEGTYRERHSVYGRGGEPCVTCGTALRQTTLGQRTTVWCGQCQPARLRGLR